jgi:hydroxyacylglutathione hydrolase
LTSALKVHPFVDEGLGNSSYLVDVGDRRAIVVDPSRDVRPYREAAERMGLAIAYAAETHLHADFISGGRELLAGGTAFFAPAEGGLLFPHQGLSDGDEVDLGGLTLRAIASPGHTPEHLAYAIVDGKRVLALFSGGALIVGSIARTDLIARDRTQQLTRSAYRSVHERFGALPPETPVYPTHGAGSFCSTTAGAERVTTLAQEQLSNPVFTDDEDAFVARFLAQLGTYPPYFLRLRDVNRQGPGVIGDDEPQLASLAPEDVRRAVDGGAVIVDVRPFEAFATGHIPGAISIELRPQFAAWLGWVVPQDRDLIFVLDDRQDRTDLIRQCLKIGYERLAGELSGGIDAWDADLATIALIEPGERRGTLVDVRQRSETANGRIGGSTAIELGTILDAELPDGPLTLYCGHGQRGMTAASLLERDGRTDLAVLHGGPDGWTAATGEPLEA